MQKIDFLYDLLNTVDLSHDVDVDVEQMYECRPLNSLPDSLYTFDNIYL